MGMTQRRKVTCVAGFGDDERERLFQAFPSSFALFDDRDAYHELMDGASTRAMALSQKSWSSGLRE